MISSPTTCSSDWKAVGRLGELKGIATPIGGERYDERRPRTRRHSQNLRCLARLPSAVVFYKSYLTSAGYPLIRFGAHKQGITLIDFGMAAEHDPSSYSLSAVEARLVASSHSPQVALYFAEFALLSLWLCLSGQQARSVLFVPDCHIARSLVFLRTRGTCGVFWSASTASSSGHTFAWSRHATEAGASVLSSR